METPTRPLTVAYVGNFGPEHSTENHVARAIRAVGHHVERIQETPYAWHGHAWKVVETGGIDVVLWTHTHGLSPDSDHAAQSWFINEARARGVPVVGYHLDLWWGLARQHQAETEPFLTELDLLVTADGGHDDLWRCPHVWMPPAVSLAECQPGRYRARWASPIAFVGSWQGGYHPESEHRAALVAHLAARWGAHTKFWPKRGQHAIRGADLQDLYRSTQLVIGDSCMVGTGLERYWSDRIPETLGRGGRLLHPFVIGLRDHHPPDVLPTWPAWDWHLLDQWIEAELDAARPWEEHAFRAIDHVRGCHTYEVRMRQLVDELIRRGLVTS